MLLFIIGIVLICYDHPVLGIILILLSIQEKK
jgi:hypothetical protein